MAGVFKIIRNHWKKTIFFNCISYYVSGYLYTKHRNFLMMRDYCHEAATEGAKPLPFDARNKHITLLLNPVSARRKSKERFEKYAEPILHCAGYLVNLVQTERISEARDLTQLIEKTNIIAIAGGDGTLLETITGLLRRDDADDATRRYPIAIIPTGMNNEFAHKLYSNYGDEENLIAEAAMSLLKLNVKPKHVLQFEVTPELKIDEHISEEKEGTENKKPVFAMTGLKVGQFREAEEIQRKMAPFLGKYLTTFISLMRTPKSIFKAEIRYTPPCYGCRKCYKEAPIRESESRSVWSSFYSVFRPKPVYAEDKHGSENPECGVWNSVCVETAEFNVSLMPDGYMRVDLGGRPTFTEFVHEGLNRLYGRPPTFNEYFNCNEIEIKPIDAPEFCSIDHEEFEMQEIKVKLLRNKVYFITQ